MDGYKLVPAEPTEEMMRAGMDVSNTRTKWQAMLAAAPASPQAAQPVAIKEAYEEGFSHGARAGDEQCNWKGFNDELQEGWSQSDAAKLYTHADAGEVQSPEYQTLAVKACKQEADILALRAALLFYANRDHFSTEEMDAWDSCSGEPSNILWHKEEPWFIEDGEIARVALSTTAKPEVDHE